MKLFFKRPPEVQAMLGRLLDTAISDVSDTDVHDRALLYYRLLCHDVQFAKRVVGSDKDVVQKFVEEEADKLMVCI